MAQDIASLTGSRLLTADQFQRLADVPPEMEWFANLGNQATRRAYENALQDFMQFTGIVRPKEFRTVTRAHVIAWRDDLAKRILSSQTIRHRLAALSSLFEYLCERTPTGEIVVAARAASGSGRLSAPVGLGLEPAHDG